MSPFITVVCVCAMSLPPCLLCRWHTAVDKVKAALPPSVDIKPWRMQIFGQLPYSDNYQTFKKKRGNATQPLQRPKKLPALPAGLDVGQVPSTTDLEAAVTAAFSGRQAPEVNLHELRHNNAMALSCNGIMPNERQPQLKRFAAVWRRGDSASVAY